MITVQYTLCKVHYIKKMHQYYNFRSYEITRKDRLYKNFMRMKQLVVLKREKEREREREREGQRERGRERERQRERERETVVTRNYLDIG